MLNNKIPYAFLKLKKKFYYARGLVFPQIFFFNRGKIKFSYTCMGNSHKHANSKDSEATLGI